jgi:excisionase family DNA binding protein
MKQLLTANQVAELINCQPSTVYAWAKSGDIPSIKLNGLLRFDQTDIEGWIEECRVEEVVMTKIKKKHQADSDIDRIIRGAIASESKPRYTSPIKGKPDQSGPERR